MPPALPSNPDPVLNVAITPELIAKHGLTAEEYAQICAHLGREPNLTELGVFSVMWSEHCSYKNSRPVLKLFPTAKADKTSPHQVLVKAGEENAGVVDIGEGWAICFKIESHNHPSNVEPYEGAATGVGGIVRDIFTMGARPVALSNSLRFGPPDTARMRRLIHGVVEGIAGYGNCLGIPNVAGDVYFDETYRENILVNALCLGLVKTDAIKLGAASGVGNPVYYVGAATGRDGLGGASFASKELSEESQADRPAVQKGDPFMEKLLIEACLEMMAVPGLVVGIQDMGAAGLTCSTCETAARGRTGVTIELDKVPQRETGMNSYEILLSESQERMLVIVQKGREAELEAIFEKWDLHAVPVGLVAEGTQMRVEQHGSPVADIPALALTDEAPTYRRQARRPAALDERQAWRADSLPPLCAEELEAALAELLASPTVASKRWITQQYDHTVMASTVVAPGSDAAVVRLRLDGGKEKYIALANDGNARYVAANPYRGGMIAIAECARNLACSGAVPLGMTNCLNFGNPHNPEVFYQFHEAIRGLADACRFFDIPVLGGNVSLYNQTPNGPIDPTPVVALAGLVADRAHITTQHAKAPGDVLILLGGWPEELGASEFLQVIHGLKTGDAPELSLAAERDLQGFLLAQIASGRVRAAHDLSEGGLLCALSEMLFTPRGTLGARVAVAASGRLDARLFGESQSRAIIAVKAVDEAAVLAAALEGQVPAVRLGTVAEEPVLAVSANGQELRWDATRLRERWETSLERAMGATVPVGGA